jgi:hypothetical protein
VYCFQWRNNVFEIPDADADFYVKGTQAVSCGYVAI